MRGISPNPLLQCREPLHPPRPAPPAARTLPRAPPSPPARASRRISFPQVRVGSISLPDPSGPSPLPAPSVSCPPARWLPFHLHAPHLYPSFTWLTSRLSAPTSRTGGRPGTDVPSVTGPQLEALFPQRRRDARPCAPPVQEGREALPPQRRRDARPCSPSAGGMGPPQAQRQPPPSPAPARLSWALQSCTPSRTTHLPRAPSAVKRGHSVAPCTCCVGIN